MVPPSALAAARRSAGAQPGACAAAGAMMPSANTAEKAVSEVQRCGMGRLPSALLCGCWENSSLCRRGRAVEVTAQRSCCYCAATAPEEDDQAENLKLL